MAGKTASGKPKSDSPMKTGTPLDTIAGALGITVPQLTRYAMYAGILCVVLGIGSTYIICAIGVAYPCFMTFLALESDEANDDK